MPPNRILSIRPVTKAVGAAYYVGTNNEGQVRVHALLSSALADFLVLLGCYQDIAPYRQGCTLLANPTASSSLRVEILRYIGRASGSQIMSDVTSVGCICVTSVN